MSKERDQLLGHGDDNDGIDEYDNPLPGWWLGMFVVCIIWGVGYAIDYHFISHRSQAAQYDAEMAAAEKRWPQKDLDTVAAEVVATPEAVAAGKEIYVTNCASCHGQEMEGGIGPSLVDDEWIHGAELKDIVKVVTEGVPEKGMITWGPILGPEKVAAVSAYVHEQSKK